MSWEEDGYTLDLAGNVRTLPAVLQPTSGPEGPEGASISQLRLTLKATAKDWLSVEAHAVQVIGFATRPQPFSELHTLGPQRYRALKLSGAWSSTDRFVAIAGIDRLSVTASAPWFDVTVGRQPINFSKAYFWSPLDVFLPFSPRVIDREYKPGVDAVRVDVPLGEVSGLNAVAAAGPELRIDPATGEVAPQEDAFAASADTSAFLVRAFTNVASWDVSVQAGSVYGGYQLGAGVAGELLEAVAVRAEATYKHSRRTNPVPLPSEDGRFVTIDMVRHQPSFVIGLERRFESSLYLSAEYFYNGTAGKALERGAVRSVLGETTNLSSHLVGAVASYELLPTLVVRLSGILALPRPSSLITPGLTWSPAQNVDIDAGALVAIGARPRARGAAPVLESEFGSYPHVYYMQMKAYF
uniref:Uncharacterized protein n=1 Tax=Sorangium cellulosum TaxID=56 RepID=A0A0M3STZ4_SORCE|nr:hypothetical protein [Sorangium cellulosum]